MIHDFESVVPVHVPRPPGSPLVLEDVRVLDFTHFLAGPFSTMVLADLGADVIKVEPLGAGDGFRRLGPFTPGVGSHGAPFAWTSRNKRSISINLKTEEGIKVIKDLIRESDVLCENFSSRVMAGFGLSYEEVRELNPRIVYCSTSTYGREGKFKDRPGFDAVLQAESGFMSMNGYPDRDGVRVMAPVIDISTGMMAACAVLGALLARNHTGRGQHLEVALFDDAMLMTGYASLQYLYSGVLPQRSGTHGADSCPSGVFGSSDARAFYVNAGADNFFLRLCAVLGRPELAEDVRFSDAGRRVENRYALIMLLSSLFEKNTWAHWQSSLRASQIPCGEVRDLDGAIRSEEQAERPVISRYWHPTAGWLPNVRLPITFSETPVEDPRPAPDVGQHTHEVLAEVLGYKDAELRALAACGALAADVATSSDVPQQRN